jgi:hypothetical protein
MKLPHLLLYFGGCFCSFVLSSCGYHVAGRTDLLPKNIQTIAIPAFANITTRYKVSELLAGAVTREFITRTRYHIVTDPNQADAVLTGSVVNFFAYPILLDPSTARASSVQAIVMLQIYLRDRATGAVLFSRPNMEFRQNYELSVDPRVYFDESDVAIDRLSRDVARSVVSGILANF